MHFSISRWKAIENEMEEDKTHSVNIRQTSVSESEREREKEMKKPHKFQKDLLDNEFNNSEYKI